jgi:hypothetical protein
MNPMKSSTTPPLDPRKWRAGQSSREDPVIARGPATTNRGASG